VARVKEEYRAGRLTRPDLRRLLGFEAGHEIDGFLKAHEIYDGITLEELNSQLVTPDRLGLEAPCVPPSRTPAPQ